MRVNEIFTSIQGEGVHAGKIMTFIRLSGCNLKCTWCDTKYASDDSHLKLEMNSNEINPTTEWICITGGEPLIQADAVAALAIHLKSRGKHIEVETNGSISPPAWAFQLIDQEPMIDSWVVDIKLASTGNPSNSMTIFEWASGMKPSDQLKIVVADEIDLGEAEDWINRLKNITSAEILISPALTDGTELEWIRIIADFCVKHNVRLSLQLHKLIWGNKRGV